MLNDSENRFGDCGLRLLETLKSLRIVRGKQGLKLCPKCKKPSIKPSSTFNGWLIPEEYVCLECGYRGPIVLEVQ
ncbi:hypothetical protein KEJ19_07365 [Candidatus Bathyarchaeota archaeon]|nr:hypothetical protein [Candidatus Bathyarchaeota archaeon]